jgi:tRNA(Arg) A34 adenosine deaminase TadA
MTQHVPYITRCNQLADEAVARGNHPFGALLVVDGRIVATARNEALTSGDVTRHAEMVLLTAVLPALPAARRSHAVLYSSTEPCAMCAGAIYWSGIGTVVYGCSTEALASAAGGEFTVPCRDVFARGRRTLAVAGPVLEDAGRARHLAYWQRGRE